MGKSGSVSISGDSSATIYVTPNYPYANGPSKTVTFTLGSGTGYNVVSGWSTAMDTIYYDYPFNSGNPADEEAVTMACYKPDGSQRLR